MKKLFQYFEETPEVVKSNGRHAWSYIMPKNMGAEGFAMGYHVMEPGGTNLNEDGTGHIHELEQEAMFFIEGTGVATIGEESFEIRPNSAMLAPKGVPHSITNTSKDQPLKFVWAFSPPTERHMK